MRYASFPLGSLPAEARVPSTLSPRRVARRLGQFVLLMIFLAGVAPWQQNVSGDGKVVAFSPVSRRQLVEAPIDGVLDRVRVREGDRVRAGDVLIELRDVDPSRLERLARERDFAGDRVRELEARVLALETRLVAVGAVQAGQVATAKAREVEAAARLRSAAQSVAAAAADLEAATLNLSRHRILVSKGLVSQRDLEVVIATEARTRTGRDSAVAQREAAQAALDAAGAALRQAEANVSSEREAATAAVRSARHDLQGARTALLRAETGLARQARQQVRAPREGTILKILSGQGGELVKAGEPLVTLVPETTDRAVAVMVDGRDAALIVPGRKVRLQFEGWPAVQFVGWPSVAVGTFGGVVAFVDASDDGKGNFRVLVTPDPEDEPWPAPRFLRQGVLVHGWVLLEVVPLGYELWRQFNGFPPSLVAEPPDGAGEGKASSGQGAKADGGSEGSP